MLQIKYLYDDNISIEMTTPLPPTPNCNYLNSDQILFGWYPDRPDSSGLYSNNINALLSTGRTVFVNLTTSEETHLLYDYVSYLDQMNPKPLYYSYAIPDCGIPNDMESFRKFIIELHKLVQQGHKLYIHCRGGHGRSGIVAGCLLIQMGHTADEALDMISAAHKTREYLPNYPCPQTDEQRRFIQNY